MAPVWRTEATTTRYYDTGTTGAVYLDNTTDGTLCTPTTAATDGWVTFDSGSTMVGNTRIVGDIDVELRQVRNPMPHMDAEEHRIEGRIRLSENDTWQRRGKLRKTYGFSVSQAITQEMERAGAMPYLTEQFVKALQESAKDAGQQIARELVNGHFPQQESAVTKKQMLNELLSESMIEIPTEEGIIKVPLSNVVKRSLKEGEALTFDYEQVRLARVQHKKVLYTKKVKSITICKSLQAYRIELADAYKFWGVQNKDFSNLSEENVIKELKALTLLRKLVSEDQFKNYMQNRFVDVPDYKSGKVYRIHRDQRVEVIDTSKQIVESRLCLHLDNPGGPKTDEFIMKVVFAKNDPKQLFARSNKYDCNTPVGNGVGEGYIDMVTDIVADGVGWRQANGFQMNQELLRRLDALGPLAGQQGDRGQQGDTGIRGENCENPYYAEALAN